MKQIIFAACCMAFFLASCGNENAAEKPAIDTNPTVLKKLVLPSKKAVI
jgi:hypothetical protein